MHTMSGLDRHGNNCKDEKLRSNEQVKVADFSELGCGYSDHLSSPGFQSFSALMAMTLTCCFYS